MFYPTGKTQKNLMGGGGGGVASTPSHPLVRRRVKMTKSVTANGLGVGSTRSVLKD